MEKRPHAIHIMSVRPIEPLCSRTILKILIRFLFNLENKNTFGVMKIPVPTTIPISIDIQLKSFRFFSSLISPI